MKKLMTFMLTLLMCIGMMMVFKPMEVKAADIASGVNGTCHWVIDENGVLTIKPSNGNSGFLDSSVYGDNGFWYKYRTKVKKVVVMPGVQANKGCYHLFYGFNNCTEMDLSNLDTSNVVTMFGMFEGCTSLKNLNLSNFDTSNVQIMSNMFYNCSSLEAIDVSHFDMSNVIELRYMFYGCRSLKDVNAERFDVSNVTSFQAMFENCSSLTSIDLSRWDTSNMSDCYSMFWGCTNLQTVDLSNWSFKDGSYGSLGGMFTNTSSLKTLILKNWHDLPNGLSSFLYNANGTSAEYIDVTGWNLTGVKNLEKLFYNYSNVSEICGLETWNLLSVESIDLLFYNCLSLKSVDGIENWNMSSIKTMKNVFGGCSSLEEINLSNWDTQNCQTFAAMFYNCSSLKRLNLSNWDLRNVRYQKSTSDNLFDAGSAYSTSDCFGGMFSGTDALKELICQNWHNLPEGMTHGFGRTMSAFNTDFDYIDVSGWDLTGVKSLYGFFGDCDTKEIRGLNTWDVSSVESMNSLFYNCDLLTELDLSNWDTSSVVDVRMLFYKCTSLEKLDISKFDLSNVIHEGSSRNGFGGLFDKDSMLSELKIGSKFSFGGDPGGCLCNPPTDDVYYGTWSRIDMQYGPLTAEELQVNYKPEMAGTWIWTRDGYSVSFTAENASGSMPSIFGVAEYDNQLPANKFAQFGSEFDHWEDDQGHTYADKAVIPANTYAVNDKITLTAVFRKRDTSVAMQNGEIEFSIHGGEKATFKDIPAGTSYQVYELTPDGWVLVQQENASGVIEALEESAAAFWNQYQPGVTTVQFSGLKTLDGHPASEGSYNFELLENGKVIDTATTQDGGFIQFKVIEYDAAGDHTYTIREVEPDDDSVDYDTHEETVTVSVTDDGKGNLSSEVTYDEDGIKFENHTRPGILRITKNADVTEANKDDKFTFEITFSNENGMPISDNIYWYVEDQN